MLILSPIENLIHASSLISQLNVHDHRTFLISFIQENSSLLWKAWKRSDINESVSDSFSVIKTHPCRCRRADRGLVSQVPWAAPSSALLHCSTVKEKSERLRRREENRRMAARRGGLRPVGERKWSKEQNKGKEVRRSYTYSDQWRRRREIKLWEKGVELN